MTIFDTDLRARLMKLSTTNVADALDAINLKGSTHGVRPIWEGATKICGPAVTVKVTAAGVTKAEKHLCVEATEVARPGDVIVVDNGGRLDTSCWGGILANAADVKGVSGVVIDGACRDIDDYVGLGFPVYARGAVTATARGRIIEDSTNQMIQFSGVQVRPGDVVLADRSGVVFIPTEYIVEVIARAEALELREAAMISDIRGGASVLEVDKRYSYETMLQAAN